MIFIIRLWATNTSWKLSPPESHDLLLHIGRCLWAPCQRCSEWLTSNGKSIPASDLQHSQALTGSPLWMSGASYTSLSQSGEWWGLQMIPGPQWSHATSPAPAPTSALHYAHYRPNQIKVMYCSNAMDFPSTYGLSLSSMTQERGPTEAPKLERLVHLSTQDGKGHTLKELTTNVRLENGARTLTRLCRFLFIFPHCKFWSRRAIRQNPCSNIIIRLTSAIRPEPNSIDWWP